MAKQQHPPSDPTTALGARGLVVVRDVDSYNIISEKAWRELDSYPVTDQVSDLKSLSTLNVSLARLNNSVFVDLDQLKRLAQTAGSIDAPNHKPTNTGPIKLPSDATVILKEEQKLYVIPVKKMKQVNGAITGDAAVLVARDAVLAPIPETSVPSGTFCVLINFLGIAG